MADKSTDNDLEYIYAPDKKKRNPLVLLGAITTAGVLFGGLVAFRKGNLAVSQQMMRARVVFQGITVAIMVGTSGVAASSFGSKPSSE